MIRYGITSFYGNVSVQSKLQLLHITSTSSKIVGCALSFTPGNLWTDQSSKHKRSALMLHMSFAQNINCFPQENVTESQSANSSLQVLFHSTLDQRNKPPHVESVFYPRSAQLDWLHVAGLSCCVRLCIHVHVCSWVCCACIKSQKSVQSELCMFVCMCMQAHLSLSLVCGCVCICCF